MDISKPSSSLAHKMTSKKGQTTQLQTEVYNEEDWEKLMAKEGLIVIDVYSDWSGPCLGMIGNLKKAKLEFGGDSLHLATAKSDDIQCLTRFRNRSEPTWLFMAGGQLITVVFGANAPKLMKFIDAEVKQEIKVLKGETWRRAIPIYELCDAEKEILEVTEKMKSEAQQQEQERKFREIEEKKIRAYTQMAEQLLNETVVICFPHTIHPEYGCVIMTDLDLFCRSQMMYISQQQKILITKELFNEIFFRKSIEESEDLLRDLASGPSLALLLKSQIIAQPGQEGEKQLGDIEKIICEALYEVKIEENQELVIPNQISMPAKYPYIKKIEVEVEEEEEEEEETIEEVTSVPACWTPSTYLTKCAAVKFLFPARAEKVMVPEEPPVPPKVVIAFDTMKQKECFDLCEEYRDDILNYGYFTNADPATAEPLCATPEQYAKLHHLDTDRLVFVIKKLKSEPLLSFAGLGATYISSDEVNGLAEADLFFPPGEELKFVKLEEAERALQLPEEEVEEEEEEEMEIEEEEEGDQNEDDLMALLGLNPAQWNLPSPAVDPDNKPATTKRQSQPPETTTAAINSPQKNQTLKTETSPITIQLTGIDKTENKDTTD